MYRLFIYEDYHYGYPFYALSALVLLAPRLIIGSNFAEYTRINLLLLRQMVSVLPTILSVLVLVYIVTRFKSRTRAVSMFIILLLIPGVVKYNVHFWHPDSLLLLFIILTLFFLQRDRLRFGRDFYFAALTCGLATATKLYGIFFFLTVGGYLLAGLIRRVLDFKKMMLAGLLFVLAMSATVVLANPFLFDSEARARMVEIMQEKNAEMAHGYDEPDPQNIYRTGLEVWLPFFEQHYTQSYFFFFLFFALAAGSLWGSETYLNRLLLAWCVVVAGYLIYFVAVKSYQYMLPLMAPLYSGAFLFPEIANASDRTRWHKILGHPRTKPILWTVTILLGGSQFIVNLLKIPAMR